MIHVVRWNIAALLLLWLTAGMSHAAGLQDFAGKPASLDAHTGNGKWLVVMIWASDCRACNHEAHAYEDFHFRHQDDNATVLGISMDGQGRLAEAKAFVDRHNISFQNLIGEPDTITNLFSELTGRYLLGTPAFLIYSPQGKLAAQQIGAVPVSVIEQFMRQQRQ